MIEKIRKELIERCTERLHNGKRIANHIKKTKVIDNFNMKSLGRATYAKNQIELCDMSTFEDESKYEIIVHEFLHLIADKYHEKIDVRNHGKVYKDTFVMLGYPREWGKATTEVKRKNGATKPKPKYKYMAYCGNDCGFTRGYTRGCHVTKNPQHYVCPHCGTKIRIEEVK